MTGPSPAMARAWRRKSSRRRLLKASRKSIKKAQKIAHSLPRSKKQLLVLKGSRTKKQLEVFKLARENSWRKPRTERQIESSLANVKKAQKVAKRKKVWKKWQAASQEARKHKNGSCDLCRERCVIQKDHDHETGQKRGKLCFKCNLGLGYFRDSRTLLKKAVKYLNKWKKR